VKALRVALGLGAIPFGIFGYHLLVHDLDGNVQNAIASIGVAWIFVAAGLIAWAKRPQSRVGVLMVFVGYALLVRKLQYSHDPLLFTVGFMFGEVSYAAYGHVVLAYPTGRLRARIERWFVIASYTAALVFPTAMLFVFDHAHECPFWTCDNGAAPRSLVAFAPSSGAFNVLDDVYGVGAYGLLGVAFIALITRRLLQATPLGRRLLAPLVLAGIFAATRLLFETVLRFVPHGHQTSQLVYAWQIAGQAALPLALLAGLLSQRLARGSVADLVVELDHAPGADVREALARALHDPTLEIAYWLPMRRSYVGGDGRPVELPTDERAVTRLEEVAAIVHDPELDPRLVEAAGAAARLALHNARLQADVRAQLAKVQESRRRIITAADEERRRIERNLHDGIQQRLVALALQLRITQKELRDDPDLDAGPALEESVKEIQLVVAELRELARGLHPAVLTEEGLGGALEALATRTPLPVDLSLALDGRLPQEIEAAAYFVACEATNNTVKHARANSIRIAAARRDGKLVVEVEDDGIGGAEANGGSGLRGLVDRVEAHGGSLHIESEPGRGTRVIGELPCAS
jgi:signal transduction histidine kinase